MEAKILSSIDGVGVFGVISIGIFFAIFAGMLIWVIRLKKSYLDSMCELPLDPQSTSNPSSQSSLTPESRYE